MKKVLKFSNFSTADPSLASFHWLGPDLDTPGCCLFSDNLILIVLTSLDKVSTFHNYWTNWVQYLVTWLHVPTNQCPESVFLHWWPLEAKSRHSSSITLSCPGLSGTFSFITSSRAENKHTIKSMVLEISLSPTIFQSAF